MFCLVFPSSDTCIIMDAKVIKIIVDRKASRPKSRKF